MCVLRGEAGEAKGTLTDHLFWIFLEMQKTSGDLEADTCLAASLCSPGLGKQIQAAGQLPGFPHEPDPGPGEIKVPHSIGSCEQRPSPIPPAPQPLSTHTATGRCRQGCGFESPLPHRDTLCLQPTASDCQHPAHSLQSWQGWGTGAALASGHASLQMLPLGWEAGEPWKRTTLP